MSEMTRYDQRGLASMQRDLTISKIQRLCKERGKMRRMRLAAVAVTLAVPLSLTVMPVASAGARPDPRFRTCEKVVKPNGKIVYKHCNKEVLK